MIDPKFTYLFLMLGTLSFPFVLSFDRKVHFYKRWRYLLPAILIPAVFFIIWDAIFTAYGIWHFSPTYTMGINILYLPVEEWMFFFFVPYACVFVYDVVKFYFPGLNRPSAGLWITVIVAGFAVLIFISNIDKIYTTVAMMVLFLTLMLQFTGGRVIKYMFRFFLAYLICLVPFALVNGVLTALPVVIYNDLENMGIRLYTIPFEDMFYFMSLFLMNISLYEYFITRASVESGHDDEKR